MKLLAIDTATEACSVALHVEGRIHARWAEAPREHGERVLAMLDEVLTEAGLRARDLDGLALGRGPGAFTGVRMATGVVQGIALGLALRVVRVSTLAALAQGGYRQHGGSHWLPAIDARMGEVYWGAYRIDAAGVAVATMAETVASPDRVPVPAGGHWDGIGTGWVTWGDRLAARLGDCFGCDRGHALPVAADLLPAALRAWSNGEAVAPAQAVPAYLRDRVAEPSRDR